jgi:hypothetical protein
MIVRQDNKTKLVVVWLEESERGSVDEVALQESTKSLKYKYCRIISGEDKKPDYIGKIIENHA